MELKNRDPQGKETNYFSNEKDYMSKKELTNLLENDFTKIEDKSNKFHTVNVRFDIGQQKELLKDITDKDVKSIKELSFNEREDYEKKLQNIFKDVMEDYNVRLSEDNKLEYYGKISYDQGHSYETKIEILLVDKNEKGLDNSDLKESINKKYSQEMEINSFSKTNVSNKGEYEYNKLIFDKEKIPQDTPENKKLYRLKSYIDDQSSEMQESFLERYSKLDKVRQEKFLEKMERARMGRDYMELLKQDDLDFEKGLFNDQAPEPKDFQANWKQNFEKEKGIISEIKDYGLGI